MRNQILPPAAIADNCDSPAAFRTPECINLRDRFGDVYRVEYEPSYYVEHGAHGRAHDPWLMIIRCQYGEVLPWGGTTLAASSDSRGRVANRLKALPFAAVAQDGDDGATVLFDIEHFDAVAEILKPRRRRRLTDAQRQRAAEHLRQYQPVKGQSVQDLARQRSGASHSRVPTTNPV